MSCNKLVNINELLTSPELELKAKVILKEYQDEVQILMEGSLRSDLKAFLSTLSESEMRKVMTAPTDCPSTFSNSATAIRMGRCGKEFFNIEIERLLDGYNDKTYDRSEFNLRCLVLETLKDSLLEHSDTKLKV